MSLVSKIYDLAARIALEIKSLRESRLKNTSDTLDGDLDITGYVKANGTVEGSNLSGNNTGDQDTIYPMVHSANMMMKQQTEFIKSINNNWI